MVMVPLWQVAERLGVTRETLIELCEQERIEDAEPRGKTWWMPDDTVIYPSPNAVRGFPTDLPAGMAPLALAAERNSIAVNSLTRLCRLGKVPGARKFRGCWYVPAGPIERPRRGRQPIELIEWPVEALPEWLTATDER